MYKIINFFFALLILIFFIYTYKYYSSNINIKNKEFNLNNINQIINEKITNIPILNNDTNNVIEFNNSILNNTGNNKHRSFWDLLKSK
tara:strand:- start:129 stop:392 length:264 start_codon:yes stop_codon:yes gene_type:complete